MELCMMSMALGDISPEEIVRTTVRCRLGAIDWIGTCNAPASRLRKLCGDAGIRIAAHTSLLPGYVEKKADWLDDVKRGVEFAAELGTKILMVPPFPRQGDTSLAEGWQAWKIYYATALPLAQAAGLQLVLESTGFVNSPVTSAAEQLRLVQEIPGLKIAFDCGNTSTAGDDPVEAWELLKEHVVHIHLKDYKITDTPLPHSDLKRSGRHYTDSVIGEGTLPIAKLWRTMRAAGYQGAINLETFDPTGKLSPEETVMRSAEYLRNLI